MNRISPIAIALVLACLSSERGTSQEGPLQVTTASPDADAGTAVRRTVVLSEGVQQLATGELAVVNMDGYSFALDLSTLSIFDLCVRNYRATAASNVWVEVWASNQIPQIGGDLTHVTVATYAFGLVNGYSTRCQDTGAIPMTPPNPGQYWLSIVVYEGSGAGRTLQFVYTTLVQDRSVIG